MDELVKLTKAYRNIGTALEQLHNAVSGIDTTDLKPKGIEFVTTMGIACHTITKQYDVYTNFVSEVESELEISD